MKWRINGNVTYPSMPDDMKAMIERVLRSSVTDVLTMCCVTGSRDDVRQDAPSRSRAESLAGRRMQTPRLLSRETRFVERCGDRGEISAESSSRVSLIETQHPPVVSHVTSSRAALGSRTSTTGEAPGGLVEHDGKHKHVVSLRSTLLRFFRIRRIDPFSNL